MGVKVDVSREGMQVGLSFSGVEVDGMIAVLATVGANVAVIN